MTMLGHNRPPTPRLRSYLPRRYGTAKEAFATLIEDAGGFRLAARASRLKASRLQQCTDPSRPDAHAPLDVIEALQRFTGNPAVTEYLAAQLGCLLLPIASSEGEPVLQVDMARIGEAASALFRDFAEAIAGDCQVDATEASRMMQDGDAMVRAYMHMRGALQDKVNQCAPVPA